MEKDWVRVFHSDQAYQAEIAKEILENEEIQCVLINAHDTNFPSIGEVEIWVHQDFKDESINLLKDLIR